jgi:hypothetical protein
MLETITSLVVILSASAISLGVGSSTLAISEFLVAFNDGKIDESERRLLGVIYIILRIAMVAILLTTLFIAWQRPEIFGAQLTSMGILVAALYVNAFAMTKHWVPTKFGPAIQAATWYTLGFLTSIQMFSLFDMSVMNFLVLYAIDIIVAIVLVNAFIPKRK